MTQIAQDDIVKIVRDCIKRHKRRGWPLEVVEPGTYQSDDWWYVPVRPGNMTKRTVEYYDLLAEVEGELQDEKHLNVLLIPTGPDQEP